MVNKRIILQGIIILSMLVGLTTAPLAVKAVGVTPLDQHFKAIHYQEIPESYQLVAENTQFQLYANQSSLAFKVVDKRSGYIWHSNLDEKIDGDRLNKTWTAFASSGISIDYLDQKAISERASITNSELQIVFNKTAQGFHASVTFTVPSITIDVIVTLEEHGVVVDIPFELIKEANPEFKLGLLYVYPFLGYTRGDTTPGYMFIPDGCGSLIRFATTTKATNMFYSRYYGNDLGMLTELPYDITVNRPLKISIPVFGMVHGEKENAFLSIVEKGASYGDLHAHPAGIITNFNFMYSAFIYNQSYFQATNRSGAGVTTLQKNTNAFDIKIHYRFLTQDESDYVGMARSYQQYLIENGVLSKIAEEDKDIGIRLEFLGGEKEKVLFWNRLVSMTTVEQMANILDDLEISNPEVVYYGWQPLGASTMPPKSLKLDSDLGDIDQLRRLVTDIEVDGGHFYLYYDPQAALYGEGGYSPRYDLAMSITNSNLIGYNRYTVNYYFNYPALSDRLTQLGDDIFSKLNAGLALDNIGSMLYSDFKPNNILNREQTIEKYGQLLDGIKVKTAFYLPNDYFLKYSAAYYDMPLSNNGYIYMTESVPFIQIALSGYIPYYGKALNFSSNMTEDLLLHADYGIYPSYFLTQEITAKILNTRSAWIYTSSYDQWGDEINRAYKWLNQLLSPVIGHSIIAREILAKGVVAVTYENGKQIVVNYTEQPYEIDGVFVEAKDAIVREVQP